MSKIIRKETAITAILILLFVVLANAQSNANKVYPKDSVIKADIIDPLEKAAADQGEAPDWNALNTQIATKYDTAFAGRLVNKAQIYYDYGKDWPAFTAALVRYTEKYEDHNNLPLLNKNAGMVAQFSTNKKELETALAWSKTTLDKEPGNADYQKTYNALKAKIAGD